jgi:hypothetical protein
LVADGWAEEWADGWAACEGEGKGGVKGLSSRAEVREKVMGGVKGLSSRAEVREKVRGEYKFSSLMKPKKGKFYFVIYIAGIFCKKISVMK